MPEVNHQPHPLGLTCLVCLRKLGAAFADDFDSLHQPSSGTAFTTSGHYGSTVFDPMNSEQLEITICDPCLAIRAEQGIIAHLRDGGVNRWTVSEGTKDHVQKSMKYLTLRADYPLYAGMVRIRYMGHDSPTVARILVGDSEQDTLVSVGDVLTLDQREVEVTYVADTTVRYPNGEIDYNTPMVAFQAK